VREERKPVVRGDDDDDDDNINNINNKCGQGQQVEEGKLENLKGAKIMYLKPCWKLPTLTF